MPFNLDLDSERDTFRVRYHERADGRMSVWIRLDDDSSEVGPIELDKAEAEQLGSYFESVTRLLWAAQERSDAPRALEPSQQQSAQSAPRPKLRLV